VKQTYLWLVDAEVAAIVGWMGLLLGFIGLALTVAVYRGTAALRLEFLANARIPKQLDDLKKRASIISESLGTGNYETAELRAQIASLAEVIRSTKQKVHGKGSKPLHASQEAVLKNLVSFSAQRTEGNLMEAYVSLNATIEAMSQWIQDRELGNTNG
jgi:hypothetical protein